MKLAYFDACYGAAGDMILGALVDAGVSFETLRQAIEEKLGVHGLRLERSAVTRAGVTATRVHVQVDAAHDHHRHLRHIVEIIEKADLSRRVQERAIAAFEELARAEAKVHDSTPEKIHFHEVGCLDAIADVTGAMVALDALGIEKVVCSPLALGCGFTRCAHGVIPVPAPATVEILRGVPTYGSSHEMELTTPTGAAVLKTLASAFGPQPIMAVESIGYGSGTRSIEGHANFLRVFVGQEVEKPSCSHGENDLQPLPAALRVRRLSLLVTEVDDMNPEILGDLMGRLFDAGCLDVHYAPIQMKKNRPGTQIQVLCAPEKRGDFAEMLLRHTSTFGLKVLDIERACLPRRKETIETELGLLEIKIGLWDDAVLKVTPEYESCRRLAEQSNLPVAEVYAVALSAIAAWRKS
jgi:uncharacterized protein (TIGR00299 family) protein